MSRGDSIFQESLRSISRLNLLHSSFFPLHRALRLLLKSASGQCLRPQLRDGDVRKVLVGLLVTGAGRRAGAALGLGSVSRLNSGWSPLLLGHGCAQTVEPLLLVVDVVDVQGVALVEGGLQGADAENVFS